MSIDQVTYRKTMGFFATGVAVLTLPDDEGFCGITMNSLTSVSLDPSLVLFCIKRHADTYAKTMSSRRFTINILNESQEDIAHLCARKGGGQLKVSQVESLDSGINLLHGAIASLDCETIKTFPGGDHTIILAQVHGLISDPSKNPLIFYRSEFQGLNFDLDHLQKVAI